MLRVAVIGAGFFARFHYEAWARLPDVELIGACDLDPAKAQTAASEFGGAAWADPAAMVAALKPDLIDIASPPATHLAMVRLAAEAGIACICQKPLAPTLAESAEIVAVAKQAGIPLIVHENFRFQPWYREIKRWIDGGRLGELYQAAFRLRPGDGQGPEAYLSRQPYFQSMDRFLIHETGIHLIDVFRFLFGEITSVYADLRRLNPAIAGEDAGHVLFSCAGGARALFDGNRLSGHAAGNPRLTMGEMTVEGSHGTLFLNGDGGLSFLPLGGEMREVPYDWENRGFGGDCVAALQAHAADHLLRGGAVENAGEDYLRNIEIEEAVYRSAAEGRRIELDQGLESLRPNATTLP